MSTKLPGNYAMLVTTTKKMKPGGAIGTEMTVTNKAYGLATIEQDGNGFKITESGCHIDVASDNMAFKMEIPDAVPQNIADIVSPLTVTESSGNVTFARASKVMVVGANLANPATDALPTEPDDPAVFDQDQDSHPGITLKLSFSFIITNGEIYAVQRQTSSYSGTIADDMSMSGNYQDVSEQNVLDANLEALKTSITQTTVEGPGKNTIRMVRLATPLDCAGLIAAKNTLFP